MENFTIKQNAETTSATLYPNTPEAREWCAIYMSGTPVDGGYRLNQSQLYTVVLTLGVFGYDWEVLDGEDH